MNCAVPLSGLPPLIPSPPPEGKADKEEGRGKDKKAARLKGSPKGERFNCLNAFVDFGVGKLARAEALTWLVLFRDTRDGLATVSYDAIAQRIGCNPRSVGNAVRRLKKLGLVQIVRQGGYRQGPSTFRVLPPKKG